MKVEGLMMKQVRLDVHLMSVITRRCHREPLSAGRVLGQLDHHLPLPAPPVQAPGHHCKQILVNGAGNTNGESDLIEGKIVCRVFWLGL